MSMSDDRISAWLDGDLSPEDSRLMEQRVAADPVLAARADRLRSLDDLVRQAVPLEETLPQELLARLGLTTPEQPSATIIDFAAAREARKAASPAAPARFAAFTGGGWRIAAQVLIVLGIGFGAMHWLSAPIQNTVGQNTQDAAYHMLGDAPSAASQVNARANALVVFSDGTDAAEVQAIAGMVGARIIGGRTGGGGWRMGIDPARRDAVLEQLRARDDVRMAEPLDGGMP